MTQREAALTGMLEYHQRHEGYVARERAEWERTRWQVFVMMQMHPYIKDHQKAKTPQTWIPFPWEKLEEREVKPEDIRITASQRSTLDKMLRDFIDKRSNAI